MAIIEREPLTLNGVTIESFDHNRDDHWTHCVTVISGWKCGRDHRIDSHFCHSPGEAEEIVHLARSAGRVASIQTRCGR